MNQEKAFLLPETKPIYSVSPEFLKKFGKFLTNPEITNNVPFPQLCETVAHILAKDVQITGLENVPKDGPVIVMSNHPFHFDYTFFYEVMKKRPDIKPLLRYSPFYPTPVSRHLFFIHKEGTEPGEKKEVRELHRYLHDGGSIFMNPWGSLDHQGTEYSSEEQSIQHVLPKVNAHEATVLPVTFDVTFHEKTTFPLRSVAVNLEEPIPYTENSHEKVRQKIHTFYQKYVHGSQVIPNVKLS